MRGEANVERIRKWTKANPILSFFVLAAGLMYILVFPTLYLYTNGLVNTPFTQIFLLYMSRLAVYSPILAGLLVTRWIFPVCSPAPARNRWLAFGFAWVVALAISTLDLWRNNPDPTVGWVPMLIISIPIAILPAYVISSAFSPLTSLREYLSTLVRPRGNLIWYLIALFTFPLFQVLGVIITQLLDGRPLFSGIHLDSNILLATMISFASVLFYSGGINEEGGWRRFAQQQLQSKYSPLVANLLLWMFLVMWHVPNDILQYRNGGYLNYRIGLYPFITILFGWVYNRTQGSILAPALFHASMNSMNTLGTALPFTNTGSILLVVFAAFAVFYDHMWKKLPSNHHAVFNVPVNPENINDSVFLSTKLP
jgi:membrane protease YdiL (CAAX protease family)